MLLAVFLFVAMSKNENDKTDIDWLAVEADYRPNKLSLRAIGDKHGCTEGAIRKKAKKEGWVRDLAEKIKSKADDLVRREQVRKEYAESTELEIINANAINNAQIQICQRKDVTRMRSVVAALVEELEHQESFVARVDCSKKISESMKTLIELERKVYKIDGDDTGGTFEDWLKKQAKEA